MATLSKNRFLAVGREPNFPTSLCSLLPALLLSSCGWGVVDTAEGSLQSLLLLTSFS